MMMNITGKRKDEHISINLEKDVQSNRTTGFEYFTFKHNSLPELDLRDVSTRTSFLGKELKLPLMISSMTGGTTRGDFINLRLAEAAQTAGIAMGVGSQRAQLETIDLSEKPGLRKIAPGIPLYANIGAVQLNYGYSIKECQRAVDLLEADALILHLNPLQEALQPEGQTNFSGLESKIESICKAIPVPVIVKEVGWGINLETAKRFVNAGVTAIDVAGAGGTSWSEVEKHRSTGERYYRIAAKFRDWGNSTADCIHQVREGLPEIPLIASGGLEGGMDLAKAIALGADICGIARPFLLAANHSIEAVMALIGEISLELRITMFAAGAADIFTLADTPVVHKSHSA
ncbi:MAG TPA: type 2 isopentenyl-diphosphate Delta-isomerase [Anaerolineaceae bacterium]|nr:type 2 isopentenyl-diphosphate Delta-isomerase [Anaerolineaceae bacterium]